MDTETRFTDLAPYRLICVTGPQRSGTTICARMIARDLPHTYVDEETFDVRDLDLFSERLKGQHKRVIHCPAMARYIHRYAVEIPDLVVIFMIRDLDEIKQSEQRIGWQDRREEKERGHYLDSGLQNLNEKTTAAIKYEYWRKVQRPVIPHWREIEYDSLSDHELWIGKDKRVKFEARQWQLRK